MFSIGEFSTISGITVRTLRYYHDEGLLVPSAIDVETGYRTYDERNLEAANVIVALRGMEFSLDDIREILSGAGEDADVLVHLERQRELISVRLKHYRDVVKRIDDIIHQQREAREFQKMTKPKFEIQERDVEPIMIAGVRTNGCYSDIGKGLGALCKQVGRHIVGHPMCLYYDSEYREDDADFEPCVPIRKKIDADGISIRELAPVRCVTLVHQGPYEDLQHSYARVLKYVKTHGYEITLPSREVYLKGPGMIFRGNPKNYLTEIQLPIKSHAK